jgi:hypothetical protein
MERQKTNGKMERETFYWWKRVDTLWELPVVIEHA